MESVNGLYLKHDVLYISKKLNVPVGAIISHLVKEKKINKRSEAKGYEKYIKTNAYLGKVQANANKMGRNASLRHQLLNIGNGPRRNSEFY